MTVIRELWNIILTVGYLILILLVGLFAFTVPDQATDFVYVMLQDAKSWTNYSLLVVAALFLWSFITWYSACIMMQTDPMNYDLTKKYVQRIVVQTPRILGISPWLIMIYTFVKTPNLPNSSPLIFAIISLVILAAAMYLLFYYLDERANRREIIKGEFEKKRDIWPTYDQLSKHYQYQENRANKDIWKNHVPTLREEWCFIKMFSGMRFYFFWIGGALFLFSICMCYSNLAARISWFLKPATVLIFILIGYTFIFTVIYYFNDMKKRPIIIFAIGWILVCSNFNDNTTPFYQKPTLQVDERLTPEQAFDQWLKEKWANWKADTARITDSMPVFFIATQGGGIRGTHWTADIINHLDTLTKGKFYRQVFCVSGVSGGGVGAGFYTAYVYDKLKDPEDSTISFNNFMRFIGNDFLSPVTASFGFGDNLQRFLPFPIKRLDRSKMLALSWQIKYAAETDKETLEVPFLNFWYDSAKNFNTGIPSLLINGTLAENGQRVVTSNLKIENGYFSDDIDFFGCTKQDITMAAAILNCCRFPFLTSGGLLSKDGCSKGHIVDGGYRENSGLQSLVNVYYTLLPMILHPPDSSMRLKPVIIYLKNGGDELDTETQAVKFFHDFLTPVKGIVSVNGTAMPSKGIETMVSQGIKYGVPNAGTKYHMLWLANRSDKTVKLPLGWYISDTVIQAIKARVKELPARDKEFYADFNNLFQ